MKKLEKIVEHFSDSTDSLTSHYGPCYTSIQWLPDFCQKRATHLSHLHDPEMTDRFYTLI